MKFYKFKTISICFIFLLISHFGFSERLNYKDMILNQRIDAYYGVRELFNSKNYNVVYADVISSDEFLKQISSIESDNNFLVLNLIFPDIGYVDDYIEEVSKKVRHLNLIFFSEPNDVKYMNNRDYYTYEKKMVNKKVEKLSNVKVYKVNIPETEIEEIFIDSLTKKVIDTTYFKKYIVNLK